MVSMNIFQDPRTRAAINRFSEDLVGLIRESLLEEIQERLLVAQPRHRLLSAAKKPARITASPKAKALPKKRKAAIKPVSKEAPQLEGEV